MTRPAATGDGELREALAAALYWHMTEADESRGCALRCGYDGEDRSSHLADALLPVVSAWAERQATARAAEELRAAADAYCGDGISGRALHSLFAARAAALTREEER